MKKFFAVLLFLVFSSSVVFAAVDSVKVSGDLTTIFANRHGFNLSSSAESDDSAVLGFTRVRIDTNLTEDVTATVRLLNERLWGSAEETAATTDIDLDLAYFTMNDFMGYPIELTVGRQEFKLGSGMLIGDPDTNLPVLGSGPSVPAVWGDLSMRKSFDGLKAVVDLSPVTVTAAYLKMVEGTSGLNDDTNAYVLNAGYNPTDKLMTNTYYVLKDAKKTDVHNIGVSAIYLFSDALNLYGEYTYQSANDAVRADGHRSDYAMLLMSNYTWQEAKWMPTFSLRYCQISRNWDFMYEDMTPVRIAQNLAGNSNVRGLGCGLTLNPSEDLKIQLDYLNIRYVADHLASITIPYGAGTLTGDTGEHAVGDELDFSLIYNYTEDVQLGFICDIFVPNSNGYFSDSNDNEAYQTIGSMKISF